MSKWDTKTTNDYLDRYVNVRGDSTRPERPRRAQVIGVPFPSRAKWDAMLAAYAPGCGSPTPVAGTEGSAPCGSMVGGEQHLCHHCAGAKVAEALLEDENVNKEWLMRTVAMETYLILYTHRYGVDAWAVRSYTPPTEAQVIHYFNLDFEPDEELEIKPLKVDIVTRWPSPEEIEASKAVHDEEEEE